MFSISRIEMIEVGLTLREPFRISSGTMHERRILLVKLTDHDGVVGWGECVAAEEPNYSPETVDTAWLMIHDYLAPRLLSSELPAAAEAGAVLARNVRGHKMAIAALEMACWELEARRLDIPLARLLGGTRDKVGVGLSIGIQPDPETLRERVAAALKLGYQKIKVKIQPGSDLEFIRAAVEEAGGPARVMADANNAYDLNQLERLQELDSLGLMMIEQPLAWDDVIQHAELQSKMQTRICLDESITGLESVQNMVQLGSGKIVNIKPGRVGGFSASIAIHDYCQANDIPVWCGGMLESGVGRAHNVALASLPNFSLPGDLAPSRRYWDKDVVVPEWTMDSEGWVRVPWDRPGMGVEVDQDDIDNRARRVEVLG